MEVSEESERIRDLFLKIRGAEVPKKRGAAYRYSRLAYLAFAEIAALREDGFSMAAICSFFKKDGLLPEGANLDSFRRAFREEAARREKKEKRAGALQGGERW